MTSALEQHVHQPEADPAHELFDILDDSGNVIGQEARGIVHKLGLLHRAGVSAAAADVVHCACCLLGPNLCTFMPSFACYQLFLIKLGFFLPNLPC